jgi:hypothetical protein
MIKLLLALLLLSQIRAPLCPNAYGRFAADQRVFHGAQASFQGRTRCVQGYAQRSVGYTYQPTTGNCTYAHSHNRG